jgi:hypothetical protein
MLLKSLCSMIVAAGILAGSASLMPEAEAKHGRYYNNGNHYGWYKNKHRGYAYDRRGYYDRRRNAWIDYKTGKIIKGGLVGAGIGAGAGLLLDRHVGKSALVGAGIGAGTQAIRYSNTMRRHPIVKTAAYGALAGTGVSAATGRGSLGKGALWGAAIGTGVGALGHLD